ncbi:MAG: flavodoxin family protein [Thermoprotei archaeon]|nr:MAG: flavodoxin family protein [Thermoprotei archaeon]RLF20681.1 MAG: flavodoxin family protein [Thermoprotei archaeon]
MSVKILILYFSRTGNTEKMAKAVAEGAKEIEGVDVVLKSIREARPQDLLEADGIIIGSPTYYGTIAGPLKKFLDETVKYHGSLEGKVGGAFSSCGAMGGGAETTVLDIIKVMLIHGMIVQGNPEEHHFGVISIGSPDKEILEACKELGRRVARLAKQLKGEK